MLSKHLNDQSRDTAQNSSFDAFLDFNQNMPINSNSITNQKDLAKVDQKTYRSRVNIQKTFKQVANKLQHHEIHNIYHTIVESQKIAISQFQSKSQMEQVANLDEQYYKNLRRRCLTIKQNNMTLLQLMLNLKQTFTRALRPVMSVDDQKYQELYMVKDKIQQASADVSKKLHQLIASRLFSRAYTKKQEKRIRRFEPINIPLTQLKVATEIIDRQLIKQRQQIRLLVKQLFNQNM